MGKKEEIQNQDKPLVSIITVCKNSGKTIRDTIESVLNQTYKRVEYLIIDGKSTDDTLYIANQYTLEFARRGYIYKIISEEDDGIYDAMNKGIRLSAGQIVGIINSDDWYERHAVETAVNVYCADKYDMFYGDLRIFKPNGKSVIKHSRKDMFPSSRHWNHPTTFIDKRIYDELGLFKNRGIHDDFDMVLRIRKANKKIVIKNEVLANFRMGGTSNDRKLTKCLTRCKDRYRCYRDNGYGRATIIECVGMEIAKFLLQ